MGSRINNRTLRKKEGEYILTKTAFIEADSLRKYFQQPLILRCLLFSLSLLIFAFLFRALNLDQPAPFSNTYSSSNQILILIVFIAITLLYYFSYYFELRVIDMPLKFEINNPKRYFLIILLLSISFHVLLFVFGYYMLNTPATFANLPRGRNDYFVWRKIFELIVFLFIIAIFSFNILSIRTKKYGEEFQNDGSYQLLNMCLILSILFTIVFIVLVWNNLTIINFSEIPLT